MKFLTNAILLLAIIIGGFLFYMGMFNKILITEEKKGPYPIVYIDYTGQYSGVGKPMEDLSKKMRQAGFTTSANNNICLYYNDPKTTPIDRLRTEVGAIVSEVDMDKIKPNLDRFSFKTINEETYYTAEFPIRNPLSYMIGPSKIYPLFTAYFKKKGLTATIPSIEIYDRANKKIIFLMKAVKQ